MGDKRENIGTGHVLLFLLFITLLCTHAHFSKDLKYFLLNNFYFCVCILSVTFVLLSTSEPKQGRCFKNLYYYYFVELDSDT